MNLNPHWIALRLGIGPHTRVLDVGGSAAGYEFGDVTNVDVLPSETGRKTVLVDITRETLPFDDNEFEVCICTHTLEDVHNPFLALDEIQRVASRGYFEMPHRGLECAFGVSPEQGVYPGWGHHHWMFETTSPKSFRVIEKGWHLLRHEAEKIASWSGSSSFEFFWQDDYDYSVFQCLDKDGDHWHELLEDHNAFVARNRHLIRTVDEVERDELIPQATARQVWTRPIFGTTSTRRVEPVPATSIDPLAPLA